MRGMWSYLALLFCFFMQPKRNDAPTDTAPITPPQSVVHCTGQHPDHFRRIIPHFDDIPFPRPAICASLLQKTGKSSDMQIRHMMASGTALLALLAGSGVYAQDLAITCMVCPASDRHAHRRVQPPTQRSPPPLAPFVLQQRGQLYVPAFAEPIRAHSATPVSTNEDGPGTDGTFDRSFDSALPLHRGNRIPPRCGDRVSGFLSALATCRAEYIVATKAHAPAGLM